MMSHHGRTFAFASRFLPPTKRRAAQSAYAFCRIGDDLVDRASAGEPVNAIAAGLDDWEQQIDHPTHPVSIAFAAARAYYGIPEQPVHDLFTGFRMDLNPHWFSARAELDDYCYYVAGTVGLIVAPILGCESKPALRHAVELGTAMQLTNILRDVAEDALAGRLYLPLEDLAEFGVDPESILAGRPNGDFRNLMRYEIDRAREFYASAREGVSALDLTGQLTTLASSHLYAHILGCIEEQDYDVFRRRAHVSMARKLRALPVVAGSFVGMRLTTARMFS
jgi:phytoene synthase